MDRNDVAIVVERLGNHYGKDIDPAMAHAFYEALHPLPAEAARAALDRVLRQNRFMPNPTEFLQATQIEAREIRRRSHAGECQLCEYTWIEGDGGVYPCPACTPDVHELWQAKWAPDIARRRAGKLNEDTRLEANPVEGIKSAREALDPYDEHF